MKRPFIYAALAAATLAGCGRGHQAQGVVEQFMADQMGISDYDAIAWSDIDSTFRVSDAALEAMRQNAEREKITRKGATYKPRTEKLHFLTLEYAQGKDTLSRTFYLDDKLEGVVAVKGDFVTISHR